MTEYFTRKICVSIKFQLGGLDIKSNLLKIKGAVESRQLPKSLRVTALIKANRCSKIDETKEMKKDGLF